MRLIRASALAFLVLIIPTAPAWAHAALVDTTPADGARLDEAPSEVRLTFNEPVVVSPGAIRVFNSSGSRVDRGDSTPGDGPEEILVTVPELTSGAYVVTWRAASADGHPVKGAFVFQIGASDQTVDESLLASLLGSDADVPFAALSWLVRWITYGAVLVAVGGALFQTLLVHRHTEPVTRLIRGAAGVGIIASVLQVPVFAAEASGLGLSALGSSAALEQAVTSSVGWSALVRVAAFAVTWFAASRRRVGWMLVGVTGLVIAELITGHTRTADPVWVMVAADAIHVAAVAVWFGGLVALALSLRSARLEDDVGAGARMVGGFSTLAVYSVVALSAAGLAMGWIEVRAWRALISTSYGWTLVAKTLIVAAVVAVGAYNNRILVPSILRAVDDRVPNDSPSSSTESRLAIITRAGISREAAWQRLGSTVRVEIAGLIVVLGVTALLVNLQPAAEAAGVTGPYSTFVEFGDGQLNLVVDPNRAGSNEIHIYVLNESGLPARTSGEAEVEMRMPADDIGPIVRQTQVAGPGHYIHAGPELAIPGEWVITVKQRTSQFEETTVDVPVVVNG